MAVTVDIPTFGGGSFTPPPPPAPAPTPGGGGMVVSGGGPQGPAAPDPETTGPAASLPLGPGFRSFGGGFGGGTSLSSGGPRAFAPARRFARSGGVVRFRGGGLGLLRRRRRTGGIVRFR